MKTNATKAKKRPNAGVHGDNSLVIRSINAFTEALAADSRQALNLLTRRF